MRCMFFVAHMVANGRTSCSSSASDASGDRLSWNVDAFNDSAMFNVLLSISSLWFNLFTLQSSVSFVLDRALFLD